MTQTAPAFKGEIKEVSADSATDAWAIGEFLIVHWNGKKWAVVKDSVSGTVGGLEAIHAFSKDNVWIAGIGKSGAFILHWNGKTWTRVSSPALAGIYDLTGIAGASPADVWAVGTRVGGLATPAIVHWNGKSWSKVKAPLPPGVQSGYLNAVGALSPGNAWAAGGYSTATAMHTLVLHWNGRAWSRVASPNPNPALDAELDSVTVLSPSNAWATGFSEQNALLLHWNSRTWTQIAVNDPASVEIRTVTAFSPSNAWAVGDTLHLGDRNPLLLHWNGKTWTKVASPAPQATALWGMAAVSPANAWAVGAKGMILLGGTSATAVILHWNGKTWTKVSG